MGKVCLLRINMRLTFTTLHISYDMYDDCLLYILLFFIR
jgi:hypothetical protein